MSCPQCGDASQQKLIAPGYFRCENLLSFEREEVIPLKGEAIPHVRRTTESEICGTEYQMAGEDEMTLGLCSCGLGAVAACTRCAKPLCGDHAFRNLGRQGSSRNGSLREMAANNPKHFRFAHNRHGNFLDELNGTQEIQFPDMADDVAITHVAHIQAFWRGFKAGGSNVICWGCRYQAAIDAVRGIPPITTPYEPDSFEARAQQHRQELDEVAACFTTDDGERRIDLVASWIEIAAQNGVEPDMLVHAATDSAGGPLVSGTGEAVRAWRFPASALRLSKKYPVPNSSKWRRYIGQPVRHIGDSYLFITQDGRTALANSEGAPLLGTLRLRFHRLNALWRLTAVWDPPGTLNWDDFIEGARCYLKEGRAHEELHCTPPRDI